MSEISNPTQPSSSESNANGGLDILGTLQDDRLNGSSGDDKIGTSRGSDVVAGGSGNDEITLGGGKKDKAFGGDGDDIIRGGRGKRDVLKGELGNDQLFGNIGNDKLIGGEGNDILIGGKGRDVLKGGEGEDTFVLKLFKREQADKIKDMTPGEDKIGLDEDSFGLETIKRSDFESVTDSDIQVIGSSNANIVYDKSTGKLYFNESNSVGDETLIAKLSKNLDISNTDFEVF